MSQIRKELGEGHWHTTRLYEDAAVAASHHQPTSWLWGLPENDQALLIAEYRATATVRAYAEHLQQKRMETAAKTKPRP